MIDVSKIVMQAPSAQQLDFYIYDEIFEGYKYNWNTGEIKQSETSAEYFKNALKDAENVQQINIYINSLGGSVKEAAGIYNLLKRHNADVTVYIDGFAASAASVIAMAGNKLIMPKNTCMMIHNPLYKHATGNAKELRKMADDLDVIGNIAKQAYLEKAGEKLSEENLDELLDAESYLTAEECVNLGLADDIADYNVDIESALEKLKNSESGDAKQKAESIIQALESKHQLKGENINTEILQSTAESAGKPFDIESIVRNFLKL